MSGISDWLASLGLSQYALAFEKNDIDMDLLREVDEQTLTAIGISSAGHRLRIRSAIAKLGTQASTGRTESSPETGSDTPAAHAERRQVTVMFSDLVGSTALSARMDPEDLRTVIGAYHKCVAETVARFDGFVAKYMGDGVLVYFGYPQAHEDDAERSVRAGLELINGVSSLPASEPLQVRIGVATGLVVVGDLVGRGEAQEWGIVGETPNLAARLLNIAEPNVVVIAGSTRRLLGNLFELQDLGRKKLKGIAVPTQAWAALRASSVASRFEALRASGLTALVGREHELEVLERGLADDRSQPRVIDLVGEPGMGKSRLVHEFRQRIGKERAFILSGYCSPDGQRTPFLPFIEVVRSSFRVSAGEPEDDVAQKLKRGLTALGLHSALNLGLLLHLLGLKVPNGALSGLDGVLIGLRTRELFQQILEVRCRLSPSVLVVEDLHCIDRLSEELLGKIVDNAAKLRLLIVHTRRPEYAPPWVDSEMVTTLNLQPLPAGDIRRLVQARLGIPDPSEALVRQVTQKAEGNPLFAEEIVSYLAVRGLLRATAGTLDASAVAAALPASVQILITARVDRLAPNDRTLLQAASVIGRRFDPELLAAAVNRTDINARLSAMRVLDLVRLERKSRDYVFKHALVRDALYQNLLRETRATLHETVAKEIERRSGNRLIEAAEILAHHYSQTNDARKAFTYLSMAGTKSLSVYSLDEAATHFASALALLDKNANCASDDQIADFFVAYMLLSELNGCVKTSASVVEQHWVRIERLGDDPRVVRIRYFYEHALILAARYREAAAVRAGTSLMASRLGDHSSKVYAYIGEIFATTIVAPKRDDELDFLKRETLKLASKVQDVYVHIQARFAIGMEEMWRGRMGRARDSAQELLEVGRLLNDPRSTGFGLCLLTYISLLSDSNAEALSYSEQSLAVAIAPGDVFIALGLKAAALVLLRRTAEGAAALEEFRRTCVRDGILYGLALSDGFLGVCKIFQGNVLGGIRVIEDAIWQREKEGLLDVADLDRLSLAEVYLQIIAGKEKPPLPILLKNLPILLKVRVTASARIRALMTRVIENPHFDPAGHHVGRAQMLLGLLYKAKKKRTLAVQHLTEARRILSQFGQTPMLARLDAALAELEQ
jgi:class 3 adenylate cyclase